MKVTLKEFIYETYSETESINKFKVFNEVYIFLKDLSFEYPGFFYWFNGMFSIGYELKKDREIIICRYKEKIAGIVILKKTTDENKICTLRVEKRFRNNGIATELIKRGMEWLEDEKPLLTCHCTRNWQFRKLFKYFGFELYEKKIGYYGVFNLEYTYNGSLPEKKIFLNKIEQADISTMVKMLHQNHINDEDAVIEYCVKIWFEREKYLRKQIKKQGGLLCMQSFYL